MIYDSWNIRCDRQNFLSSWPIFCPFTPLTTQKIKILKYWKKSPKDINISHMCTINDNHMMYGSWDLERDRQNFVILNRFLHFYVVDAENQNFEKMKKPWRLDHFRQVYYNWQSYDAWFLRYKDWRREISTIYSPNNPKNQNFEKMKKTHGNIISHNCTKNHDHMLQCSWDTMRDRCNFYLSFWAIFCSFTPLTTQKLKIKK